MDDNAVVEDEASDGDNVDDESGGFTQILDAALLIENKIEKFQEGANKWLQKFEDQDPDEGSGTEGKEAGGKGSNRGGGSQGRAGLRRKAGKGRSGRAKM